MKKKYITLGTKELSKDAFKNIIRPLDNISVKPSGGLWASNFIDNKYCICEWLDYILYENNELAYYKDIYNGCIFTLKDTANILIIDNIQKVKELAKKYPSYHYLLNNKELNFPNVIDFEKISKEYDGIYLLFDTIGYNKESLAFKNWSVNTLLLFNLDCIQEYQTIKISANPEDQDYVPFIKKISNPKQVIDNTDYYNKLYCYTANLFSNIIKEYKNNNYENYDDYFSSLINVSNICIRHILEFKKDILSEIHEELTNQDINIKIEEIAENITLNILAKYLSYNEEYIKSLKKSNHTKLKTYKID